MLRGIIISPDLDLAEQLEEVISEAGGLAILRTVSHYPTVIDLVRIVRAHAPQIIFLGLASMEQSLAAAATVESHFPGVQFVAIHSATDPDALLQLMRVGIREFIAAPFPLQEIHGILVRISEALERKPLTAYESEFMYSFLPAKPGVGASTIAMNVASAAARQNTAKSLLLDLDLNSGMQRFMLKLDNDFSITDAAESAFKMDEVLWPQLVSSLGNMDVLHSGRISPGYRIEPSQMRHLIEFVRRYYKLICVDLSGNMEKYSVEIMHDSRRIFLVTTPEIASLHLARERYNYLRGLDLGDRIQLILNRHHKHAAVDKQQVEDLLGIPVTIALPNDYRSVNLALAAGRAVDAGSDLGVLFGRMAQTLLKQESEIDAMEVQPAKTPKRSGLASLFSFWPEKRTAAS